MLHKILARHFINVGALAEALTIRSLKVDLERMTKCENINFEPDTIRLNNSVGLTIQNINYHSSSSIIEDTAFFTMEFSIVFMKEKVVTYFVELDTSSNRKLYRKWKRVKTVSNGSVPAGCKQLLNYWSDSITSAFEQGQITM